MTNHQPSACWPAICRDPDAAVALSIGPLGIGSKAFPASAGACPMPEAETAAAKPLPVVPFLKIPESGEPYLEGYKCGHCGEVFLGQRLVCAACGTRGKMAATKLSNDGKLYNFTVVHRN